MKRESNGFLLDEGPWPRFRGNVASTGKSTYIGPKSGQITWEREVGPVNAEPVIGNDGAIYTCVGDTKLIKLDINGEICYETEIAGRTGKPRTNLATPAIREDGSIIVAALGVVQCIDADGSTRWTHFIDGIPSSPNIGPSGIVYVPAWSFSWIGMYVISPDGNPCGADDPRVLDHFTNNRYMQISPPAIDTSGRVFLAYRANVTHPEAYTWDPVDEVDEDYIAECAMFDAKGKLLGKLKGNGSRSRENTIMVSSNEMVYHTGRALSEMVGFGPSFLLDREERNNGDKAGDNGLLDHNNSFSWESYYDKEGEQGPVYGRKMSSWPALSGDGNICAILGEKTHKLGRKVENAPSNVAILIDPIEKVSMEYNSYHFKGRDTIKSVKTRDIPQHSYLFLSGNATTNPIIDQRGRIYVGNDQGIIDVFNAGSNGVKKIDMHTQATNIVIGPNNSLVFATREGAIGLIG